MQLSGTGLRALSLAVKASSEHGIMTNYYLLWLECMQAQRWVTMSDIFILFGYSLGIYGLLQRDEHCHRSKPTDCVAVASGSGQAIGESLLAVQLSRRRLLHDIRRPARLQSICCASSDTTSPFRSAVSDAARASRCDDISTTCELRQMTFWSRLCLCVDGRDALPYFDQSAGSILMPLSSHVWTGRSGRY